MDIYSIPGFEEPINSWTHLLAAFAFLCLTLYALRPSGNGRKHFVSIIIFGFSCIFLFSVSGVYHLLAVGGTARYVLQILDHAGIYLLIAGSFTAIHNILFHGLMRWGMILLVWILAINGIIFGTIFFDDMPEILSLTFYLSLGWLGIISGFVLWIKKGLYFIRYFLYGGISYTLGALLEFYKIPVLIQGVVGPHELFHIAVIMGTTFHWLFVLNSINENENNHLTEVSS